MLRLLNPCQRPPPVCLVREALPGAAVVDEQDLIALIDFQTGITVSSLGEESPAVVGSDFNHQVDLLVALLLQGEIELCMQGEFWPDEP